MRSWVPKIIVAGGLPCRLRLQSFSYSHRHSGYRERKKSGIRASVAKTLVQIAEFFFGSNG